MKLLITGGAGFLGARLARTLLARGGLAGQRIAQRRHPADPAVVLRHPKVHRRATGGRLHAQRLHRRPQPAADAPDSDFRSILLQYLDDTAPSNTRT
ncbi:hypothetical protein VPH43_12620 [Ideonella sp. BN130291]|nr:hypothetical protein [Ideonella sp. BN130291]